MSADEQRKLAAIMFTDMVGYSALSQRDDKLALELLEEHRQLLREIFPRFNGTEIKTIGDAFLIEFNSALEAAQCAIEIQRTLAKRNHDVTAERRIELKIGIHIGDVVHRGGDVYGDGVNIASRIEPLAGAGGICVSMDVERQIRNALEARFEKLAPTDLKNISVPMDLFRIVLPWEQRTPSVARFETDSKPTSREFVPTAIALGLLLMVGIGWWWTTQPRRSPTSPAATSTTPATDQKSIAVLPFVDMSPDKDQEYFSDGIAEELLNRLAQVPDLKVAARTSAFQFRGKNLDMADIGRQLKVAHALEGSVRKSGGNLRISAQLIQCNTGYQIWSQAYDRKLDDVFAIQEEIARAIAEALSVQLKLAVAGKLERPTQDMAAYADYLEARALITKRNANNLRRATTLLEAAVQRDPGFAKAWAALAQARALGFYYLVGSMKQSLEGAESAARKALAIDDSLGAAHSALADVLRDRCDWLLAEAEYRRALEISPGEAETHNQYAQMLLRVGHLEAALEHATRACELDPLASIPPSIVALIHVSRGDLAQGRIWLDRFEKARGEIDGLTDRPNPSRVSRYLVRLELIYALSRDDRGSARRTLAMARSSTAPELSSPADKKLIEALDGALASSGNSSEPARNLGRALTDARALGEPHVVPEVAIVAAFLNQPEVALDALSADMRSAGVDLAWVWRTPPFGPLHNERRFLELLKTMKLPEYWRVAGWPAFCRPLGANDFECVPHEKLLF